MFEAENINLWRDHDVVDREGSKIGSLESVYVDTATDRPSFAGVKTGIIGRHRIVFVPLDGAVVGPDYLKVQHAKDLVKNAPGIETDGELLADAEPAIFAHYDLAYSTGAAGERRLARR
ncbi:PRC-barrel domain-containing protein [Motilibacter aurantiacus]|uniref:PRC-barrel domain-containing protein n=1 Tax=Motilibacter aurantiacus TaxID=2714955 RepID=UPI00140BBA47|nr:PRC-barrel domain containing protein [Motilibacter aurantiacus]